LSDHSADASAAFWNACRSSVGNSLDGLAQRIDPAATWNDLVLPDAQVTTLREIATQVKHRAAVYDNWGFARKCSRGLGISVLFAGESGTGKTMAAEVLASELQLELYRIDLAATVSKYIGETEKNLARLFDAAEDSGVILLFDEADALFGKRGDVRDGRDRYANIEISYLLQRMETYRGLAILTTNQRGALDTAFARRIRFVVPFSFPDQPQRERIWRGVFPAATPLDGVDYGKLARLGISGGSIRNIALGAAFLAAEAGQPIGMTHLLWAARNEGTKRDRPFSDAEIRGWV
jgi:SpoVK/Ycf46/Vps4 family AAA+-type ATPase